MQLFGRVSGRTTARSLLRLHHEALHFLCVPRRSGNGGLSVSAALYVYGKNADFVPDGTRYAEATKGVRPRSSSNVQEDHEIFDLVSAVEKSEGQPRAISSEPPPNHHVRPILLTREGHELLLLAGRAFHGIHGADCQVL